MPHESPLSLTVARRVDLPVFHGLLVLLITLAVVGNPHAQVTGSIAGIFMALTAYGFLAVYRKRKQDIEKSGKLTLIIFPDGTARLKCAGLTVFEGILGRYQWCTTRIAVLRLVTHRGSRSFMLLAGQRNAHDFRRLNVWLRQNIHEQGRAGQGLEPGLPSRL